MKFNRIAAAALLLGAVATAFGAKTPDQLRVYINPGHGSWTGNDRPMQVIGKGAYSATNTDTTGFFESNTNLQKGFGVLEKLIEMGMPFDRSLGQSGERWEIGAARVLTQNIVMSRVKNGPYEANNTTSSPNYMQYNRKLLEIATEVEHNEFDIFISIHSNAASSPTTNYHLFMYRGHNGKDNVLAPGSWEMAEAAAKYSFANDHAAWSVNYPYINGDIDFMSSDNTGSTNELGYYGYLGVLKHGVPGYLVEGYFHTYMPSTHRAMNFDVDIIEGYQYARGVAEYFQFEHRDGTGEIYGIARDMHERFTHALYKANPTTDDKYKPLNGVDVVLKKDGVQVATYKTDEFYNGAFVFKGLQPGTYTVELSHPDYKAPEPLTVEVKAGVTSYPKVFMETVDYVPPTDIAYNYPDPLAGNGSILPAARYNITSVYADEPIAELEGLSVKRTFVRNGKMYILALDKPVEFAAVVAADQQAKATILVYDLANKQVVAKVSTEGAAGSIAAIADMQLSADGVLLACNATKTQYDAGQIQEGDAGRGTFVIYKWANDENGLPTGNPVPFISTTNSGLWYRAYPSQFVYSGTTTEGKALITMPTITAPDYKMRATMIAVADGEAQAPLDIKPGNPLIFGQRAADFNLVPSPIDDNSLLMLDSNLGIQAGDFSTACDGAVKANSVAAQAGGRSGIFKYAGASFMVYPKFEGETCTGLEMANISGNVDHATAVTLTLPAEAAAAAEAPATLYAAAAGETEVTRDAVTDAATDGWINLYLLRDGKISKFTTRSVAQPQARKEYAYNLKAEEKEEEYEISFSLTGNVPAATLRMIPEGEGQAIEKPLGALEVGENFATVFKSDLEANIPYTWEIVVTSEPVSRAGLVFSEASDLTVRGGVVPITDPEQPSFGYVAVGHGKNQGIDIYNPAGQKVATRIFKDHAMFGGVTTNQSNPFRGNERNGYAVFSTFGDAGYGIVAVNPLDVTEEPFTLFTGTKSSTGCFITADNVKLGGGNSGFDFINDEKGDTWVIMFSEDHQNQNGKGDSENALVKVHMSGPWAITEAPEVLGYRNFLANQNVDVVTCGDGVFVAQIRESGNNIAGTPAFGYISNVLGESAIALNSADESIAENVPHSTASIAVTKDGKTLAIGGRNTIVVFAVTWNEGVPTLKFRYQFPVESHIWSHLRFDHAGNLHAYLREGGYRVYSLPEAEPTATTPAPAASVLKNTTGISDISLDDAAADTDAIYYNLQGVQVSAESLTPGIYVRVSGGNATKVAVK